MQITQQKSDALLSIALGAPRGVIGDEGHSAHGGGEGGAAACNAVLQQHPGRCSVPAQARFADCALVLLAKFGEERERGGAAGARQR